MELGNSLTPAIRGSGSDRNNPLDTIPAMAFAVDQSYKIVSSNKLFAQLFNRLPFNFEQKSIFEFTAPCDQAVLKRSIDEAWLAIDTLAWRPEVLLTLRPENSSDKRVNLRMAYVPAVTSGLLCILYDELDKAVNVRELSRELDAEKSRREAAEFAFRRSEEQLNKIINGVPALIAYVDKHHVIQFHNGAYGEWYGCDHEHVAGKHMRDVLGETDYLVTLPHVEAALRGNHEDYERTIHFKDGSMRHVNATYHPHIERGEVVGFHALVMDVSDRKQAQSELRARTNQQMIVAELGLQALQGYPLDQLLDDAIKLTASMLSVEIAEFLELVGEGTSFKLISALGWDHGSIGNEVSSTLHNTHAAYVLKLGEALNINKLDQETRFDTHSLKRQGIVSGIAVPVRTKFPFGVFGIFTSKARTFSQHDVNFVQSVANVLATVIEKRRIEAQLNAEKERALVTLESMGDGVITTDQTGKILSMNSIAEALTGWHRHDALGLSLQQVFICRDQSAHGSPEFFEGTTILAFPQIMELENRANHSACLIENAATPIRDPSQKITGIVVVFRDVSEREAMANTISYQASHDALTGLVNRYEFDRAMNELLRNIDGEHALCYIDIDQFKVVNDTCGHAAGDELLREVSQMLKSLTRQDDTLARLGGDEFALLLQKCTPQQAMRVAGVILETIRKHPFKWKENTFSLSASIGLVPINSEIGELSEIMRCADTACITAKELGRNRAYIYELGDLEVNRRQGEMHWVSRITQALQENRFVLYYQPITPLSETNNTSSHFEVLLRMIDVDGAIIPPGDFIPAAETYGLMPRIDRWVIKNTFSWCLGRNLAHHTITINLSGTSLTDDSLVEYIEAKMREFKIDPSTICFEVTETAAITHLGYAQALILRLKELGCRFALDDFGSGMSSFSYLKQLPVDYLKIDGSFVVDMDTDEVSAEMVKAINQVGQAMGIKTIAEYAERESILEKLRALGVDYAQGMAIAEPAPLAQETEHDITLH